MERFDLHIVPPWWLQLLVGALGGCAHGVYVLATSDRGSRRWRAHVIASRLVTGAVAGSLAYLLAAWNILGVQIETTSLRAYAIMGFLFAYVGVDAILKHLVRSPEPERGAAPPDDSSPAKVATAGATGT
jgi:hypothetical protein